MRDDNTALKLPPEPPPAKRRKALVADLLCGAGGTSTGAQKALNGLGWDMELVALNHWPIAIETHTKNHPKARHFVQDIASVRPIAIVPEGYLDLLMASPTCTHHSRARGAKPTSDQQRSDPWHIITWLTELRVKRMLIENVPEFVEWGPVDRRTMRPVKSKKGEYFNAWLSAIQALGFKVDWRIVNCANYGDATTRERFFLIARSDGKKLRWADYTHAKAPATDLFGPGLKKWRGAREIIDWKLKGRSIYNRKRPLAAKTLQRIYAGAIKFKWSEPYIVVLRNHMASQGIDVPLPSITAGGTHIGIAQPIMVNMKGKSTAGSIDEPAPAITAHARHLSLAEPFIATVAHGNDEGERDPHSRRCRSPDEPLQTIHAGGGKFGIVEPFLLPQGSNQNPTRGVGDPVPTITTVARVGLVEPFILSQASGGAPRSTEEPVPTITTGGNGSSHALITPYYGSGSGTTCKSVDDPLPTITTLPRFGMVVPVTNSNGGPGPRDVDQPLPTLTTAKGGELAFVAPVTHHDGSSRMRAVDEPLPTVTGAHRGELAFIAAQFGEREGQSPRVHSLDEPAPTICATGHINLVEPDEQTYDILFRMLEPRELAAAMGFIDDDMAYEFAGNKTQVTKQIGNAVPVRTAAALVTALMRD